MKRVNPNSKWRLVAEEIRGVAKITHPKYQTSARVALLRLPGVSGRLQPHWSSPEGGGCQQSCPGGTRNFEGVGHWTCQSRHYTLDIRRLGIQLNFASLFKQWTIMYVFDRFCGVRSMQLEVWVSQPTQSPSRLHLVRSTGLGVLLQKGDRVGDRGAHCTSRIKLPLHSSSVVSEAARSAWFQLYIVKGSL